MASRTGSLLWLVPFLVPVHVRGGELAWPPSLPEGRTVVTDASPRFLARPATIGSEVTVASTPPVIDFLYYAEQHYPGNPWSNWGDAVAVGDTYYSAIGDHRGPHDRDAPLGEDPPPCGTG